MTNQKPKNEKRCGHCGMIIGSKQACCQPWIYDEKQDKCVNYWDANIYGEMS